MNKRLLIVAIALMMFISTINQSVCYGQSSDFKTDGKAYQVSVELYFDKIVVIDEVNNVDSILNWYLTSEDLKAYNDINNKWYYDYTNDILYRVNDGILYNMNDL